MKPTTFKIAGVIFLIIGCILFEIGYNVSYIIPNLDILSIFMVLFTFFARLLLYVIIVSGYYFLMEFFIKK